MLDELIAQIGEGDRTFVEFGIEDGLECNCAQLALERGWRGVFIEGSPFWFQRAREHYQPFDGVRVVQAHLSAENVRAVFQHAQVPLSFDVLSIDVDGNDYWIWRTLCDYQPRIVVIEYNPFHAPPERWIMPYDPHHSWEGGEYFGASLSALTELGKELGYALVGTTPVGSNAFFVQRDILQRSGLAEVAAADAFVPAHSDAEAARLRRTLSEGRPEDARRTTARVLARPLTFDDVAPSAGAVGFGRGWDAPQTTPQGRFRAGRNGAELHVAVLRAGSPHLLLTLEPAIPGVYCFHAAGSEPRDFSQPLFGRETVLVPLPHDAPALRTLGIAIAGPEADEPDWASSPGDANRVDFRLFDASVVWLDTDIFPTGVQLEGDWYPLERFDAETFRWAGDETALHVTGALPDGEIRFAVQPGPGIVELPLVLNIKDTQGSYDVTHRIDHKASIALPTQNGIARFVLRAINGGRRTQSDPRVLNYRVFHDPARTRS